jgi:HSP20 family protein
MIAMQKMPLNITETDTTYKVSAELPGLKKENVDVTFKDGILTIECHKEETKKEENEKVHRSEFYSGKMKRSVRMCDAKNLTVDVHDVGASFNNGVLNIVMKKLPQPQKEEPISIQIQGE